MTKNGGHDRPHRLSARLDKRVVLFVVAVGGLVAAVLFAGVELERHVGGIETWIMVREPWSSLVFIGVFVVAASLLLPESLLSIMAGALFGMGGGLVAAVAGNLLAASLQYALARRILRPVIVRALAHRPSLLAIQRAVLHNEIRLQVLLRLTPFNPAMISYLLGAAGVRFRGFFFSGLAMLPIQTVEVYLGYAGRHLVRLSGRPGGELFVHDLVIVCGAVATMAVMVMISRMARDVVMKSVRETETDLPRAG